jgi:hypothetical protein
MVGAFFAGKIKRSPFLYHRGSIVHFQWNLDYSVGNRGANSWPADVSYIQWYYTLAEQHPLTPEDRKAIYRQVQVNRICRGTDDDPLVAAMFAHQKALGHPQIDGRISAALLDGKLERNRLWVVRGAAERHVAGRKKSQARVDPNGRLVLKHDVDAVAAGINHFDNSAAEFNLPVAA